MSMDAPTLELKTAMASLFCNPKFSDLTIVCGAKSYPVHRVLLATRSTFFQGACRNPFLESETGIINLSEDDAEAVEHMIHYFYHMDYLRRSPSRRSSQRSSSPPNKLNLALVEDPLLATLSAANAAVPLTPPADEAALQTLDAPSKLPDTPMADQFAIDELQGEPLVPERDVQSAYLCTHAKVYAIAEKYGVAGLKVLARQKFSQELDLHLDSPDFPEACQEVYESTFHTDRGLRDVVIQAFRSNPGLSLRQDVEMAVRETPGLAFELYRMASARSYKNGDFSDLTITCGALKFNVHAVVVCSACKFFQKSVKFAVGKEAQEKCIDLPEDDPEMIRRLVTYLYLGDYDPNNGNELGVFDSIPRHESMTATNPTYHYRRGAFGVLMTGEPCACLSPNTKLIDQPAAKYTDSQKDYKVYEKARNAVQVRNPLTIHASMYALGDKYQVDGLSEVAKQKFESCLHHHAHSEDFISAVQLAYSTTPHSNRGLRDSVMSAFREHFRTDIASIAGAEAKLDTIDELSFLLLKSWPCKTETPRAQKPLFTTSFTTASSSGSAFGTLPPAPGGLFR
ncbi:hypothetical protein ACEQ8H_007742 [Pleosporales sp. CAS-2024a]